MARITEELKLETRDNILAVATQLFSEQGFEKTKTKTIAQLCHIAEGTLFNYFPTKDDLLIAVFEQMVKSSDDESKPLLPNPKDLIIASILAPIKSMSYVPKFLLVDLLISSVKIAKTKPKLFHKLVSLDFNYIEELRKKLDVYGNFEQQDITSQDLAEMIYGVAAADLLLYLYSKETTYAQFEDKIKPKIKALIHPYLKEVISND